MTNPSANGKHGFAADAAPFLDALFGYCPGHLYFYLWTRQGKRSHWFGCDALGEAAERASRLKDKDVYVGVALSAADLGPHRRIRAEEAAGVVGLWADVDVKGEAHKGELLPPTLGDARRLVAEFPLPPTAEVDTGHGLHAWWLFREAWEFAGDADRARAADLARRFQAAMQARAAGHGWELDPVADLARVLRVPDTCNRKPGLQPVPVRLLDGTDYGRRYDPTDFEEYLDDITPAVTPPAQVAGGGEVPGAPIKDGKRNDTLFRLGCGMRGRGMSPGSILAALLAENAARCEPPLPEGEVRDIAGGLARRYAPGCEASWTFGGRTGDAPDGGWPEPLPVPCDLPPVLPFDPAELLPESCVGFVSDVAERMQCPADYPGLALVVVLAGVVGAKLGIRPKRHDDWHVVPNLWGAVVGRPGVMKTPAIREALKFLTRLQLEAKEQYESELGGHATALEVHEAMRKRRKDLIAAAIKDGKDPAAAAEQFGLGDRPAAPLQRRYFTNDPSVEKLGELLKDNVNGLVVFRDELVGLLRALDREGQEGARAFYLEAWDGGGSYTFDRIGRGTVGVPCLTLSVFGGITPGRLTDYLRGALAGGGDDDGLIQRLQLLVYPDVDRGWHNVDRFPETAARNRVWDAVGRLDVARPEEIPGVHYDGMSGKHFLRFDEEAQQLFDGWRAGLEPRVRSGDEHPAVESHLAKYRSLVPTLALLLHLADHEGGPVGADATHKALAWAVYLESHMRRVYSLGIDAAGIAAKALGKRLLAGDLPDGFRARDVYRKHWAGLSDSRAVNQALDLLLELHWLCEQVVKTEGRDTVCYRVNPRLGKKRPSPPVPEVPEGGGGVQTCR
jgi:putative DNA primase/helicase